MLSEVCQGRTTEANPEGDEGTKESDASEVSPHSDVEGIAVGFDDISTLRESLESDFVIKKSIVSSLTVMVMS